MEDRQIILFEDEVSRSNRFKPLTYSHCVAELRRGFYSLIESLEGENLVIHSRPELTPVLRERYPNVKINEAVEGIETILINARAKEPHFITSYLLKHNKDHVHLGSGEAVAAARTTKGLPSKMIEKIRNGEVIDIKPTEPSDFSLYTSLWNIIHENPFAIESEAPFITNCIAFDTKKFSGVFTLNDASIRVGSNVSIAPSVVLDATKGSITLDDGVTVQPHSSIIGPVYIGKNSLIKSGSKIFGGTTIGPMCKVGGEIENSIILGYSNKQHDGYLGHSYLGEWCNLGAGTNTSDLRNDYGNISVKIENQNIDTHSMFVGLLMGDHSKSAIGTQFNTGTVVGVHANVFGAGFPPKWLPNYSWGGAQIMKKQSADKALEVAMIVMKRRGKNLSEAEAEYYRSL
jgi:UDP-N-acetylglucosamine diphosphorylase / glucose-1-phosphate thymidylyltransferase / UDP-N-acetylgalactosamine diphosphorylase / glucosamine-1-phosphate N-acetyltransferase / galactosamine-1-phosphate N-acetyltransferase